MSCQDKKRYHTGSQAKTDLNRIRKRGFRENGKGKKPVRSYYCEICRGWHLTSDPK